jgi:RNA polymerase sigma-70 factor, ECF subfamily
MHSSLESKEFLGLWSAHARRVYAYILTLMPHTADADDIFQETSVTLWEKFEEFRSGSDFGAWACRVAYFKTLSHLQRKPHLEPFDELLLQAIDAEVLPMADELEARFLALTDCLGRLGARDRQLVELRYQGNRSVEELSKQVGRSGKSVYRSLSRIHDLLFDCIQRTLSPEQRP